MPLRYITTLSISLAESHKELSVLSNQAACLVTSCRLIVSHEPSSKISNIPHTFSYGESYLISINPKQVSTYIAIVYTRCLCTYVYVRTDQRKIYYAQLPKVETVNRNITKNILQTIMYTHHNERTTVSYHCAS